MTYQLIDCHVHLQAEAFAQDLPDVLTRAEQAGVKVLLCNGSEPADWDTVRALAGLRRDAKIVPFFGLHPWYVGSSVDSDWQERLSGLLQSLPSGVGEIGLDRWIEDPNIDQQLAAFRAQLQLAKDMVRPACIHCLRAWGLLMEELNRFGTFPAGLIIHAFGGAPDLLEPLARLNAFFSFAGNCLSEGRRKAAQSLIKAPLDRLLIESDAPDLAPPAGQRIDAMPMSDGRYRNEPANLPFILEGMARLRQQDPEMLAQAIWQNSVRLLDGLL